MNIYKLKKKSTLQKNSTVAIYGSAANGKNIKKFLSQYRKDVKVVCFIDRNFDNISSYSFEAFLDKYTVDYVIVSINNKEVAKQIKDLLNQNNIKNIHVPLSLNYISDDVAFYSKPYKKSNRFTLEPHKDFEFHTKRKKINYFITEPEEGLNKNTGLMVVIPGCSQISSSKYFQVKLNPYIANRYNCIVVNIDFFGIHNRVSKGASFDINKKFKKEFKKYHHMKIDSFKDIQKKFKKNNLENMHPKCKIPIKMKNNEYESFGLLPALDYLCVINEIFKQYKINMNRVFALGSSYGGYIAGLIEKFSPNLFSSMIINSPLIELDDKTDCYLYGVSDVYGGINFNFKLNKTKLNIKDINKKNYIGSDGYDLRSLLVPFHYKKANTKLFIFHSQDDSLVNISKVDRYVDIMKDYHKDVTYYRINHKKIDGELFKFSEHGMGASLKKLVDYVFLNYNVEKIDRTNKFVEKGQVKIPCSKYTYILEYANQISLTKVKNGSDNTYQ